MALLELLPAISSRTEAFLQVTGLYPVRARSPQSYDLIEVLHIARLAEGSQGHYLVFIAGMEETQMVGD